MFKTYIALHPVMDMHFGSVLNQSLARIKENHVLTLLFISDLGAHGEAVNNRSVETFVGNSVFGTATTELHTVSI